MKEIFTVSFVGHGTIDNPNLILRRTIEAINEASSEPMNGYKPIAEKIIFYCGGSGEFDSLASTAIDVYRKTHGEQKVEKILIVPNITPDYMERVQYVKPFYDVIVYPKTENDFPEEEIAARDLWMVDHSDTVIFYSAHLFSDTEKYLLDAKNSGKPIYCVGTDERLRVLRRK